MFRKFFYKRKSRKLSEEDKAVIDYFIRKKKDNEDIVKIKEVFHILDCGIFADSNAQPLSPMFRIDARNLLKEIIDDSERKHQ